jgi:Nif11 domain
MDAKHHAGTSLPAGSAPLEAFCALVLEDPSLQQALRRAAGADEFMAALLDAARQRGFPLAVEDVRAAMHERSLGIDNLVGNEVKATPLPPEGWLPIRASWQGAELYVHWAYFGERRLRDPFFEGDVRGCLYAPFNRLFRHVTPIETLAAWLKTRPHLEPSGFIFHMSRCGSTLVSQMLSALPSNIVVSEASPIDTVVQADRWRPDLGEDRQALWLNSIIGALGQKRSGNERRYFVKLDCWHTLALPLFRRAFPAVPWVFLYRDPVEVLVSQLRIPGTQMIPGGIGPNLYGLERSYGPGTAENYYAQVLAKVTEPAVAHYAAGGGLLVNYRQLPDALFTAILPHFGVACGAADRAAMTEAARFDAKTPGFEFAPDGNSKQKSATPAARDAAERWLGDLYRRLEVLRAEGSRSGVQAVP